MHELMRRTLETDYLDTGSALKIVIAPFALVAILTLLLWLDLTKPIAIASLTENNIIELLTFAFLLAGGVMGVHFAFKVKASGRPILDWCFFTMFSAALIFIAMEEISWGQWFFGFSTPEFIEAHNVQGELTLHNISLWHDYIEALPLFYAMGGLFGMYLGRWQAFEFIAPSKILLAWFVIIGGFSLFDLIHEFKVFSVRLYHYVNHLDELMELLVGISGFLYILLAQIKFRKAKSPNGS